MKIYDSNNYFSPWVLFYNGNFDKLDVSLNNIVNNFQSLKNTQQSIKELIEIISGAEAV